MCPPLIIKAPKMGVNITMMIINLPIRVNHLTMYWKDVVLASNYQVIWQSLF